MGSQLVSDLYRKHRLIEVFLLKNLGYTTEEVHEEAEVLEHTVSEHFIDRLDHMLGNPKTCPHGGTIPKKGERLVEAYQGRLIETTEPGLYILQRVYDTYELLKFLDQIHLPYLFIHFYQCQQIRNDLVLSINLGSNVFHEFSIQLRRYIFLC